MKNIKRKLFSTITLGAILLSTPVFAKGTKDIYVNGNKVIDKAQVQMVNNQVTVAVDELAKQLGYEYSIDIVEKHPVNGKRYVYYQIKQPDGKAEWRFNADTKRISIREKKPKEEVYEESDFANYKVENNKLYISLQTVENILHIPVTNITQGINLGTTTEKDILNDKNKYPFMTKDELVEYMKYTRRGSLEDADNVEEYLNRINNTLKSIPLQGKTNKQKLKLIAEKVAKEVSYDRVAANNEDKYLEAYATTGIIKSNKATCSGYAEYYYLLCKGAGLNVKLVHGNVPLGFHAWNIYEEKGVKYNIDVTVMDYKDGRIDYNYFYKTVDNFKKRGRVITEIFE